MQQYQGSRYVQGNAAEYQRRVAEMKTNQQLEEQISANLDSAHHALVTGNWHAAIRILNSCKEAAAQITSLDDIFHKRYCQKDYFDASIKLIADYIQDFNNRAERYSKELASKLIKQALMRYAKVTNITVMLLERHEQRLFDNITAELQTQWHKFDRKPESEYHALFDNITNLIINNIIETSWMQRWGNWSYANVCLTKAEDKSKTVPQDIRKLIKNHVASPIEYLQLPIMAPYIPPRHTRSYLLRT